MFRHLLAIAGLAACGVAVAGPSPQTDTFNVTANVPGSCSIVSADIVFGDYDPTSTHETIPLDAAGSVSVRCTKGTAATVALNQGSYPATGSSCTAPLRQMAGGAADRLRYDIYTDSGRTTAWGCGTASQTFTSTSAATATTLQTFGRVPAGQDAPIGSYSDVVSVDVTF